MNEQNGVQTLRVLIVSKTHRARGACVGGITSTGRSVRLEAALGYEIYCGEDYEIGDVWRLEARMSQCPQPPHVEDIVVLSRQRERRGVDPVEIIERFMPPVVGSPDHLYGGLVQWTGTGALFIAEQSGVPSYSTCFWRPDRPLYFSNPEGRHARYVYPAQPGQCGELSLAYVGYQEPMDTIPEGTLLRVSLARWWHPEADPGCQNRCYVQLSGWYEPQCMAEPVLVA